MDKVGRPRVALLTNVVAPYRLPMWEVLGEQVDLTVFYAGLEPNRKGWEKYHVSTDKVRIKRSWGIRVSKRIRNESGLFDYRYIHINPGFFWDLVRFRPRAVIAGEMGFRSLCALVYGFFFRKPVWINWEGTVHSEQHLSRLKQAIRRFFARWTKHWITYGNTSTEYLLSLGIDRSRIVQIQNGVDESSYPLVGNRVRNEPPTILCVSQLIGRKGVDLLIESASRVARKGLDFNLVLVGDGPLRISLANACSQLGLKSVKFLGAVSSEEMPGLYQSADILVFPTLLDVWGLVVNEAILSGLTVATSIYAGCSAELLPKECCFDPLKPDEFDAILMNAIEGKLPCPDRNRVWSIRRNGEAMAQALFDSIARR